MVFDLVFWMILKLAVFVTKNTMSIPTTIQTHCIELAVFVTKNTMSIPTIQNTMHGIDILDGIEIGSLCDKKHTMSIPTIQTHCIELAIFVTKKHNVNTNNLKHHAWYLIWYFG